MISKIWERYLEIKRERLARNCVSIVNITKVAYPLSLPAEGGQVIFTYKVTNPGVVPLSDVVVSDDKCSAISGKLGDVNGNELLDINETWVYACAAILRQTTTNTATVTAFANGLRAVADVTVTVFVGASADNPVPAFLDQPAPKFPETGTDTDFKITTWGIMSGILAALIVFFILTEKKKLNKK